MKENLEYQKYKLLTYDTDMGTVKYAHLGKLIMALSQKLIF